jgi:large subunit ribosomal protein L29
MKIKEIRTLPGDEVGAEIDKARAKIFKMRFQGKGENVENAGSLRSLRRQIARLKTVLRERELGAQVASPGPAARREPPAAPASERTAAAVLAQEPGEGGQP